MKSLTIRLLAGLAAVLTLLGCSGAVDAGLVDGEGAASALRDADDADTPEREADTDASETTDASEGTDSAGEASPEPAADTDASDTDAPDTDASDTDASDTDTDVTDAGAKTATDEAGTGEADTTVVRLYYLAATDGASSGEGLSLTAVDREIPATPRIARATLQALIDGPTVSEEEGSDALTSAVPASTEVRGVTVDDGLATVDLAGEFESGGGSASMHARLAQLVYTATQFPTVDAVALELDGEPVEVFSGEGLLLDGPLGRDEVDGMWR